MDISEVNSAPSASRRLLPDHIVAITDKIHPEDSMNVIMPVGLILSHLEGRNPDVAPAIASLRASLRGDADVLLEWLGVKVDETDGLKVSIREGTDFDGVEARFDRFSGNL